MILLFGIYYLGFILGSVPYALFLALFASLFSIIPYVGNIIGGGVAVLLSFLYAGATPALIVIAVIAAAQLLENYILREGALSWLSPAFAEVDLSFLSFILFIRFKQTY